MGNVYVGVPEHLQEVVDEVATKALERQNPQRDQPSP